MELFITLWFNGDGSVEETREHACLDVMIRTAGRSVTITDGLLWLLNAQDGSPALSYEVSSTKVLGLQSDGTPMPGAYLGFGFRIAHAQLETHQLRALAKETLVVRCRVTGGCSLTQLDPAEGAAGEPLPAPPPPVEVPPPALAACWAAALTDLEGADVSFACGPRDAAGGPTLLHAHRLVLCVRSPVFRALLAGPLAPPPAPGERAGPPVFEVEDVAPPVFEQLLRFIYTEEFDDAALSVPVAQHLLVAADRFGVDRLKALCERWLAAGLEPETAAYTLVLAQQHSAQRLRAAAMLFVARNAVAVMQTEGWAHLCAAAPGLPSEVMHVMATQGVCTQEGASVRGVLAGPAKRSRT